MTKYIDIVFDGPPGPQSGRFIEAENDQGASVSVGEWVHRPDGYWVLRIPQTDLLARLHDIQKAVRDYHKELEGRFGEVDEDEMTPTYRALLACLDQ